MGNKRNHMTDNAFKVDKEVNERFTHLWREIRTSRVRLDFYQSLLIRCGVPHSPTEFA